MRVQTVWGQGRHAKHTVSLLVIYYRNIAEKKGIYTLHAQWNVVGGESRRTTVCADPAHLLSKLHSYSLPTRIHRIVNWLTMHSLPPIAVANLVWLNELVHSDLLPPCLSLPQDGMQRTDQCSNVPLLPFCPCFHLIKATHEQLLTFISSQNLIFLASKV